ncbi:MAG: calcium-binding protein [Clostridium sp.]|nr:calcium-binding protein [Clostridium sp.]
MKIEINDQYHSDENKKYTVDENGNIDLFISIGNEVEAGSTINSGNTINNSNNIKCNQCEDIIEGDCAAYEEDINTIEHRQDLNDENEFIEDSEVIINKVNICEERPTISKDSSWEDEKYSKAYNSIYEEIENSLQKKYSNEKLEKEKNKSKNTNKAKEKLGSISVYTRLGNKSGAEIKGGRINLYVLNGVSPKLYDSKFTDSKGKVEFNNLPNGCYRIISIVNRKFFEKPLYYNWNEVTIDSNNKDAKILVVNRIKPEFCKK